MLTPKRTKYRKSFKHCSKQIEQKSKLYFGSYGLKALETSRVTAETHNNWKVNVLKTRKLTKEENKDEIVQVMDDLISANVDFLTIGQYLQPSEKHHPLSRYYHPQEFEELKMIAKSKGFLLVSSSPLTRSSYHADDDFKKLKKERIEKTNAQSIS